MGNAYTKKCCKCDYIFHASDGVGFLFPKVYDETLEKAKSGELGQELKAFLEEHEDGAIDASMSVFRCNNCGELANYINLTMYIPKNNTTNEENGMWSISFPFKGGDYVMPWDLKLYYTEYAKYPHKCEKCGMDMTVVEDDENILCPKCKNPLEDFELILWD